MLVAFRVDASVQMGTGHVMRCLTLADFMAARGAVCHFLCRPHVGHLARTIEAQGHQVHHLGGVEAEHHGDEAFTMSDSTLPPHASWLGAHWAVDAEQSRCILSLLQPDWLVVDHYALDAKWEMAAAPEACKVLVIDDLADRPHCADLLLDQNLGRQACDYTGLVSEQCRVLVGPEYALLRPEFAQWRQRALARRQAPSLRRLLITLGGVDADNITCRVLDALSRCDLPDDMLITVVMGASAPWLNEVRAVAEGMVWPVEVVVNVNDMARRMTEADLAIGAAGSTSWERCCMGLPTLLLVLAQNQEFIAERLHASQAAINIGEHASSGWPGQLKKVMEELAVNPLRLLKTLSYNAACLTHGQGAKTLASYLIDDA